VKENPRVSEHTDRTDKIAALLKKLEDVTQEAAQIRADLSELLLRDHSESRTAASDARTPTTTKKRSPHPR